MDGRTLWGAAPGFWQKEGFVKAIDAALAQARRETLERCANEVRANAGKCVSDASCEALANAILALEVE